MADHYYSFLNPREGRLIRTMVVGTSASGSRPFELRVTDGNETSQMDVLLALDAFKAYFTKTQLT